MSESYTRFHDIFVSERILNTVFLLTVGLGYLVALSNLYYTHQGRDGIARLSVIADVTINYHGSNDQTRLGLVINGISAIAHALLYLLHPCSRWNPEI